MKLYLGHSTGYDYQAIYKEFLNSLLAERNDLFLPHQKDCAGVDTIKIIENCDLFIAEVSEPSTGLGIELGRASMQNVKILCVSKTGKEISTALRFITKNFIEYDTLPDLIVKLESFLTSDMEER